MVDNDSRSLAVGRIQADALEAPHTAQGGPNALGATLGGHDPGPDLPGGIVPDVLGVATLELRDPIALVVVTERDYRAWRGVIVERLHCAQA